MSPTDDPTGQFASGLTRRKFIETAAALGGAVMLGSRVPTAFARPSETRASGLRLDIQSWDPPYPHLIQQDAVKPFVKAHHGDAVKVTSMSNSDTYPKLVNGIKNGSPPFAGGMWNDGWAARGT